MYSASIPDAKRTHRHSRRRAPRLIAASAALVAAAAITGLAAAPAQSAPTSSETQTSTPFRAGKAMIGELTENTASKCTSGFLVRRQGVTYALTAGHCAPNGDKMYFGVIANMFDTPSNYPLLGQVSENSRWGKATSNADVSLVPVPASMSPSPTIFVSPGLTREVVGSEAPVVGMRVCTRGVTTQKEVCGRITKTDMTATFSANAQLDNMRYTVTGLAQFQADDGTAGTQGGDSGAPFYVVNPDGTALAVGIYSGSNPHYSVFTPIAAALNATGSTLATSLHPSQSTWNAPSGFSTLDFTLNSYENATISGAPSWLYVYEWGGGAGETYYCAVAWGNTGTTPRSATVTLTTPDGGMATLTVTQAAYVPGQDNGGVEIFNSMEIFY
ncbi:MAG: trypsin-like serine protease [Bifidobacteriaceae bacterium]|jgi:hypothetical protein|nr:trypsin-like serine protease [Bifidobacteriaceae bacterium]